METSNHGFAGRADAPSCLAALVDLVLGALIIALGFVTPPVLETAQSMMPLIQKVGVIGLDLLLFIVGSVTIYNAKLEFRRASSLRIAAMITGNRR